MRTRRLVSVPLVAFAALAFLVGTAIAKPSGPLGPAPVSPVATLPGSTYPWVQPVWTRVDGITLVTIPLATHTEFTQPPAWVSAH